jgi:hypothetical protein
MKNFINLFIISLFFILGCAAKDVEVVEIKSSPTATETKPPVILVDKNLTKNIFELSTYESNQSLTVVLPDGWKKQNFIEKDGEGKTTTFGNGLVGRDEKFFIVFESNLSEEAKSQELETLFENFKNFCHSMIGNVDFSPTKVIKDKRSGLVFNAALGIETTQPSLFIAASTRFSDNVAFSFICFETDQNFKTCGKIFESLKKN